MASLDIDWEEQLSKYVGDAGARGLSVLARSFAGWVGELGETLSLNAHEYLNEEVGAVASSDELRGFAASVDEVTRRCRAAVRENLTPPGGLARVIRMLNRVQQAFRLLHINAVLVRHGLDEVILGAHVFRPIRFLLYLLPWNWVRTHREPRAVRIRRALEELGPLFVKFGQILSTRRDLLSDDIADELSKLQDAVAPFPGVEAKAIVERAYQRSIGEVFSQFNQVPLASASIAQVHVARLLDDREVVVKVVRPGIENVIRRDVGLLYTVAELVERYWRESHRLRPRAIVSEFEKIIFDELDLQREAASASLLRPKFSEYEITLCPRDTLGLFSPQRVSR